MKTATFPLLRVNPELRQAAEKILLEGESLSGFVAAIHPGKHTAQAATERVR